MFRSIFQNFSKNHSLGQLFRSSQKMFSQTATELNKLPSDEVSEMSERHFNVRL